jgi:hypothetical protein
MDDTHAAWCSRALPLLGTLLVLAVARCTTAVAAPSSARVDAHREPRAAPRLRERLCSGLRAATSCCRQSERSA